jgi:hypothetical protein
MSATIAADLSGPLAGDPKAPLEVIITAAGGLDELLAQLPPEVRVDHTYRLSRSVAVTASAAALRRVAKLSSVGAMEPVRDVRTYS